MNKKLIVLTGSFNPVTKAHYQMLSDAVEKLKADKGLFVATNNAYLTKKTIVKEKSRTPFILSEDVRRSMLESLNNDNPKLFFWGFELGGASHQTNKTLKKIIKDNKDYDVYYLCGADKLNELSRWSNADEMFSSICVAVYRRSDIDVEAIINNDPFLLNHKDRITILDTNANMQDVSSTMLRDRFFNNLDYKDLMNDGPYEIMKQFKPTDFKELTGEEIIKYTILYGGRFGENTARGLVYKENLKLFKDWNIDLFGSKEKLINNTKVYNKKFNVNSTNLFNTEFRCINSDCVDVAYDLINRGFNPAILNLASAICPCGGYSKGIDAQEESLCRASTLSVSLYQFTNPKLKCFKELGLTHIPNVYPLDINYGGIYTPNVCFFRNNIDEYFSLRDKPFKCSAISVASLANIPQSEYNNDDTIYFKEDGYLTEEGITIQKNKIRTIFRIALKNHHDSLVLGDFGCDEYNLKPKDVTRLFLDVYNETEFKNKFKRITFAITDISYSRKYRAFRNLFNFIDYIPIEGFTNKEIEKYLNTLINPTNHEGHICYASNIDNMQVMHRFLRLPEKLKSNRDFILSALDKNNNVMIYVDKQFCDDKEIVLKSLKSNNGHNLKYASERLRDDIDVVTDAIWNSNGAIYEVDSDYPYVEWANQGFEFASPRLKKNKKIIKLALENDIYNLEFMDANLLTKKILLPILQEGFNPKIRVIQDDYDEYEDSPYNRGYLSVIEYLPENLQNDKDIVMAILKSDPYYSKKHIPDKFKDDKDIIRI